MVRPAREETLAGIPDGLRLWSGMEAARWRVHKGGKCAERRDERQEKGKRLDAAGENIFVGLASRQTAFNIFDKVRAFENADATKQPRKSLPLSGMREYGCQPTGWLPHLRAADKSSFSKLSPAIASDTFLRARSRRSIIRVLSQPSQR